MRRFAAASLAAFSLFCLNAAADTPTSSGDSNLPVPRFVSLKTENVNGRRGPGLEHRVDWVYDRVGLPLQVTGESGPWRRVRDPEGIQVWMHAQNLDTRRMAYVTEPTTLRRQARDGSSAVAYLQTGVVGALTGCQGEWRRVAVGGRVGWVNASALWGGEDCTGL